TWRARLALSDCRATTRRRFGVRLPTTACRRYACYCHRGTTGATQAPSRRIRETVAISFLAAVVRQGRPNVYQLRRRPRRDAEQSEIPVLLPGQHAHRRGGGDRRHETAIPRPQRATLVALPDGDRREPRARA